MSLVPSAGDLALAVTGRSRSMFEPDLRRASASVASAVVGERVMVIGGAGSIGRATVEQLLPFRPAVVHIVDTDENSLVEVVRDLRARDALHDETALLTTTADYGAHSTVRWIREQRYPTVLNFAAVKHVRAERDVPSILHMLAVNVAKMDALVKAVDEAGCDRLFAVSTDKAASPVNLMGASKNLMEQVVLRASAHAASARFANVAFSAGSLLEGWLRRMQLGQPLQVPEDTRRFFVSLEEAGQLCLLAATTLPAGSVAFPCAEDEQPFELRLLTDVVADFLAAHDLVPVFLSPEERVGERAHGEGAYPVVVTRLDTMGEKAHEEFVSEGDILVASPHATVSALRPSRVPPETLDAVLGQLASFLAGAEALPSKRELVALVQQAVPELQHNRSDVSLDDRA